MHTLGMMEREEAAELYHLRISHKTEASIKQYIQVQYMVSARQCVGSQRRSKLS
jgi:hypothetical protein